MKKKIDLANKRVIVSRTDSIGDVMLTLPLCHWIKSQYPDATVIFLGKSYTMPILQSYEMIDECVDWSAFNEFPLAQRTAKFRELNADVIIHVFPTKEIASLAKNAKIPFRIGTSHRSFHLLTCNVRLNFSRKNSQFHEAQLNHELLKPLGLLELPSMEMLHKTLDTFKPAKTELPENLQQFVTHHQRCLILHPKSQGSAVEWPIQNYLELCDGLVKNNIAVIFTGTASEGELFSHQVETKFKDHPYVFNSAGLLSLSQLMELIAHVDGLVACSTGPLHIAGFLGKKAVGLFSGKKPIHPGRWMPLGNDVHILEGKCPSKKASPKEDIESIAVDRVLETALRNLEG